MDGGEQDVHGSIRARRCAWRHGDGDGFNRADHGFGHVYVQQRYDEPDEFKLRRKLFRESDGKLGACLFGPVGRIARQWRWPHHHQHRVRLRRHPRHHLQQRNTRAEWREL